MRLLIVGNPAGRRTALLTAAARRAGIPDPTVLPWRTALTGGPGAAGPALTAALHAQPVDATQVTVRIDSPGDDPHVDRLLRGAATCPPRGALTTGPAWYRGFTRAATELAAAATASGARVTSDPHDLAVLFDKRACHTRLAAAAVPVPDALDPPGTAPITGWADLRERMTTHGMHRVFVKPAHGSSASGVLALQRHHRGDVLARGPLTWRAGRLRNSLRPGVFRGPDVAAVVDALAPLRLHIERWFPKLVLAGTAVDVRVLVVAGTATHAVVRTATGPITNLHLGNARGDLTALRAAIGEPTWRQVLTTAEAAAACFPRTHTVGVDVLLGAAAARGAHRGAPVVVAEVNAFGDLLPHLPGLRHRAHDPYDVQIHALTATTSTAKAPA